MDPLADLAWINGRLVQGADAVLPLSAHGVLYGDGVFETLRVYAGEPFRLDRHLARLCEGAAAVGLPLVYEAEALGAAVREILQACRLREAAVRIPALRGVGPPGPDPAECAPPI